MSVTYKDVDLLSQKSSIGGTEKLPVSDTEYITPAQIAAIPGVYVTDSDSGDLIITDENGNRLAEFADGHLKTKNFNSRVTPKYVLLENKAAYDAITTKDSGTLYLIPKISP